MYWGPTVDEEFAKNTAGFIAVTSEPNNPEVLLVLFLK